VISPRRADVAVSWWFLAAVGAVACGFIAVRAPLTVSAAVGSVLILAAAASFTKFWELGAPQVIVAAMILLSGAIDLPNRLQLAGGFTASALLTGVVCASGVWVISTHPIRRIPHLATPARAMGLFTGWTVVSFAWGGMSVAALQNCLVYGVFVASVIAAASVTANAGSADWLSRPILAATVVGSVLYAASVALGGLGGGTVVGNRSFALFALTPLAWYAAGWRANEPRARTISLVLLALVVASLSRTSIFASALILAAVFMKGTGGERLLRACVAVAGSCAVVILVIQYVHPLHDRFAQGDLYNFDGVSINLTGRSEIWAATWSSALNSPWIGHGAGSANNLVGSIFGVGIGLPHNDYLRLFHDFGVIGILLWIFVVVSVTFELWSSANKHPRSQARPQIAALLAIGALSMSMATDNPITYMSVMAPLGALLGAGLATARPSNPPLLVRRGLRSVRLR
jgi:O-antigen ligase